MANHLDLEEQEQLDQLKHFWKQYGNLITWVLIAFLTASAAWNGYQYWQRKQSTQAAAMFDEVEKFVAGGDVDKASRAFNDMKDRFGSAAYTQQAGLLLAKMAYEAAKPEVAKTALLWLADNASDTGYAAIARLRLANVYMEAGTFDEALKVLDGVKAAEFEALASDRRGDIYAAQGKTAEAKTHYLKAYQAMDERSEYRRLLKYKLNALGVDPEQAK